MPRRDPKQIAKTLAARAEKLLGDLRSDAKDEPAPAAPRPRTVAKESGRTITISTPAAQPPAPSPAPADAPQGADGPDVDETPEAAAPDATAGATTASPAEDALAPEGETEPPAEDALATEAETEPPAEDALATEAETEPPAEDAPAAEGETEPPAEDATAAEAETAPSEPTEPEATDRADQGAEPAEAETEPDAAAELAESPAPDAADEAATPPQQKATTEEPQAPDTADEASSEPQPAMATDDTDEAVAVAIVAGTAAEVATATPQPTPTPEPTATPPVPAPQAEAGATPPQQQATETDSDRRRRIALLAIVVLLLVAVVAAIIVSVTDGNDTIEANVVSDTIEGEEAATDTAGSASGETSDDAEDTAAPSTAAEDTETQAADTEGGTADTEPAAGGDGEAEADTGADPNATSGTAEPDPEAQDANGSADQGDVAESQAVVRDGQIVLEGAVPTQEAADAIVSLASEILGPENVVNNYVIDERAADPNLGSVRVDDPVLFEPGSSAIAADFEPLLGQALTLMTLRPSVTMTIVGHTDEVGGEQDRLLLSLQRAQAVERWLVDRGVDDDRLTALGRGDTEPIAPNDTDEGRQLNRRIQVFIENLLVDS